MSSMKLNIKFSTCLSTPKPTCPANLSTPSISTKNPNYLSPQSSNHSTHIAKTLNPRQRNTPSFLTFCSTKPHTDSDNSTDGNPNPSSGSDSDSGSIVEFNANSVDPQQKNPPSVTSKHSPSSAPTPSSRGLVFDLGSIGSWDCIEIGSPVVKRFLSDDQERWYMWYYGRSEKDPSSDSIGLAVSSNGVHWQRGEEATTSSSGAGLVMKCGGDWWAFDTMSVRPSEVMVMSSNKVRAASSVYWLYYTGLNYEQVELPENLSPQFGLSNPESAQIGTNYGEDCGVEKVFKSLPGLAISQDGRNWARIEGDHHSGALFDVGSKGEWDSLYIASPHVVPHSSGDLRMYYHSFDPQDESFGIGIARSRDGIKWVKLGKIMGGSSSEGCFDEMGVMNACVVRDKKSGNYLMAYEGVAKDGRGAIGLAVSSDGLKDWKRIGDGPVLMPGSEDGWDSKEVGSPYLVQMDGDEDQWRLYYTGVGVDGRTGIGLAVSQGSELQSFRRWTGFHL